MVFHMVDEMTAEEIEKLSDYFEQRRSRSDGQKKSRILGMYAGMGGWISDDFTAEFPDEFWGLGLM